MLGDGDRTGGMAGKDGVLGPNEVAQEVLVAMREGRFLITPHQNVVTYMQRRAGDHGRWLRGMQRQHELFGELQMSLPNFTAAKL